VREVQSAVAAGKADAAVHSAKDLPPVPPSGLCLAAVPRRGDPRDALVGCRLSELQPGTIVATGSQRRRAQLAWLCRDLDFVDLRGNIATRLARVPPGGAIVVAIAALSRLGLHPDRLEVLPTEVMLPQVGQGALAIECREDDLACRELLARIEDPVSRCSVDAERAFLAAIGGGCDLPVAANASLPEAAARKARDGLAGSGTSAAGEEIRLEGLLAAPDGSVLIRRAAAGSLLEAESIGRHVAQLLLSAGGRELLPTRAGGSQLA